MNSTVETDCRASVIEILESLPKSVPMLALGQTVFWDEPMKASLFPYLQACSQSRPFLFGVHDTDYFGRAHTRAIPSDAFVSEGFAMLPHNDGTTHALWASAGEISQLFGCEVFPTREQFHRAGASIKRLARLSPDGRQAFIDSLTSAWGWRGLVMTEPHPIPIAEVPLARVLPALDALLHWGFEGTIEQIASPQQRALARQRANQLLLAVHRRAHAIPDGTLAELYLYLYPEFLRALIGDIPETVGFTRTTELLRFNTDTAHLPRFRLLTLFLDPETRPLCENAYNACVAGSEIYTLDHFGEGAIPFDLLIPQHGRGTLLITERYLTAMTPTPKVVRLDMPLHSAEDLAVLVERHFGRECVLVGKAITLVSMLAHEFLFVFNERGSPYLKRTIAMNRYLRQAGVDLVPYPIVRVRYPTWDSLASVSCINFRLPDHLASAFQQEALCSHEFARRWRQVVAMQSDLLQRLGTLRSPRALMRFLAEYEHQEWGTRLAQYEAIQAQLKTIGTQAEQLRQQAHALHATRRQLKQALQHDPSQAPALMSALQQLKARLRALNRQRMQIGRTETALSLRQQAQAIQNEAEHARARLARHAILTAEGLPYTNARPASWWFQIIAPEWFQACAQNIQISVESLGG